MAGQRRFAPALTLLVASLAIACGDEARPVCADGMCAGGISGEHSEEPDPPYVEAGAKLPIDPSGRADRLLDFGRIAAGTQRHLDFALENLGGTPASIAFDPPAAPFAVDGPLALEPGRADALRFVFEPRAAGVEEEIVAIRAGAARVRVRLAGEAVAPALACPGTVGLEGIRGSSEPVIVRCVNRTDVVFPLAATAEGAFTVANPAETVEPWGTVEFELLLAEASPGHGAGRLLVAGPGGPLAEVAVETQVHAGPVIACDPIPSVEDAEAGTRIALVTTCTNVGDTAAERIEAAPSLEAISVLGPTGPVEPGATFQVDVEVVLPARSVFGEVALTAWPGGNELRLPVHVARAATEACRVSFPDDAVDFLEVEPGTRVEREVVLRFENDCDVRDLRVDGDAGIWSIVRPTVRDFAMEAGAGLRVRIAFAPSDVGASRATLRMGDAAPGNEELALPLTGAAAPGCLKVAPVDFGTVAPGCRAVETVVLRNDCGEPITISSIDPFGMRPGNAAFSVDAASTPATLQPGEEVEVEVGFEPEAAGAYTGAWAITWSGSAVPRLVPGRGTAREGATRTDHFVMGTKVDVVLVVDNGTDGDAIQSLLARGVAYASQWWGDWRLAVVTANYGPVCSQTAGVPTFVDSTSTTAWADFAAVVEPGNCDGPVDLFTAAEDALARFPLRPDASLAIVFATTTDDQGSVVVPDLVQRLREAKGPESKHLVAAHALVADGCQTGDVLPGSRLADVVHRFRGDMGRVCSVGNMELALGYVGMARGATFTLTYPADPDGIVVTADGWRRPIGWTYVPEKQEIRFVPWCSPAPGAPVEVTYVPACTPAAEP